MAGRSLIAVGAPRNLLRLSAVLVQHAPKLVDGRTGVATSFGTPASRANTPSECDERTHGQVATPRYRDRRHPDWGTDLRRGRVAAVRHRRLPHADRQQLDALVAHR